MRSFKIRTGGQALDCMVLGETSFRLWDTRMDKLFIE